MKKLAILTVAVAFASPAFADNFTGFGIGAEADIVKYDVGTNSERVTDANIVGSYAFAHSDFLVSGFDAKVGVASPRIANAGNFRVEQNYTVGLGYRLGYSALHDQVLPYAKVSYEHLGLEATGANTKITERLNGYGFGVGVKYAPINNLELGAEYTRKKYDSNDFGTSSDINVNSFALGAAYRF